MVGAPQLIGTKGTMIAMLDACLVNGFGAQTATSILVSDGVATVTMPTSTFMINSIISVSGATPAALNGEHRVLDTPTPLTLTFDATGIDNGQATGTIVLKVAPLGWLKPFSGTNSGAYKIDPALHPDSTACHVRISDTGNYNAQICGYESMTGIDTGAAPFPTPAQQTLWVFRSNSASPSTEARSWFIVGDSRFCYVGIHSITTSATAYGAEWFGFGEFKSKKTADPFNFAVTGNYATDEISGGSSSCSLAGTSNTYYGWLARSHTGLGGSVALTTQTWPSQYGASGANTTLPYPNGPDYGLYLCRANIFEKSPVCYRGDWPGIYFIPQDVTMRICPDVKTPYLDTAVPGFDNKVVGFFPCVYTSTTWSVVAFDLTGPWEH